MIVFNIWFSLGYKNKYILTISFMEHYGIRTGKSNIKKYENKK
jgi:hypothetical protein